jgi:hypothetical protein
MVGNSSGLCPMIGFGINGVEHSNFATIMSDELNIVTSKK